MRKEELEAKIAVLMGGRAAELLTFGHLSTGPRMTFQSNRHCLKYGHTLRYGRGYRLCVFTAKGNQFLQSATSTQRDYSEETARK